MVGPACLPASLPPGGAAPALRRPGSPAPGRPATQPLSPSDGTMAGWATWSRVPAGRGTGRRRARRWVAGSPGCAVLSQAVVDCLLSLFGHEGERLDRRLWVGVRPSLPT